MYICDTVYTILSVIFCPLFDKLNDQIINSGGTHGRERQAEKRGEEGSAKNFERKEKRKTGEGKK
jgi:hypothetical protein